MEFICKMFLLKEIKMFFFSVKENEEYDFVLSFSFIMFIGFECMR